MRSLAEELYHGNLQPDEKIMSSDPKYLHVRQKASKAMEAWKERHSADDFMELEGLLDMYSQTHGMELASSFTYGFRLGAALMIEILTGKDELVHQLSGFPDESPIDTHFSPKNS